MKFETLNMRVKVSLVDGVKPPPEVEHLMPYTEKSVSKTVDKLRARKTNREIGISLEDKYIQFMAEEIDSHADFSTRRLALTDKLNRVMQEHVTARRLQEFHVFCDDSNNSEFTERLGILAVRVVWKTKYSQFLVHFIVEPSNSPSLASVQQTQTNEADQAPS